MSEKCEIIISNGLETRVWTYHPTYGYGCAECCNGDRCDEDCDAKYRRPNCPHCGGSGWIKKDDASTPPTTEEAEIWKEIIKYLDQDIDYFLCIPELMQKYQLRRRSEQKLSCSLDEQQCRDSCEYKANRSECPFTRSEQNSEAIEFAKEKVTELVTLAYKEGFSRNGRPLGEWGDHYNENEAELKEYIGQLFKQNP